jgi:hypothetical protein
VVIFFNSYNNLKELRERDNKVLIFFFLHEADEMAEAQ